MFLKSTKQRKQRIFVIFSVPYKEQICRKKSEASDLQTTVVPSRDLCNQHEPGKMVINLCLYMFWAC